MGDMPWACRIFQRLNPSYQQSLQVMVKVESVSESFKGVGDQILRRRSVRFHLILLNE